MWEPYILTSKFYSKNVLPCPNCSLKFGRQSIELLYAFLGSVSIIEYYCNLDFQLSEHIKPVGASGYPCAANITVIPATTVDLIGGPHCTYHL